MKKIWKLRKNAEAVSPVIATILMVAITVVLAAVLYVMVMGFGGGQSGQTPTVTMTYQRNQNGTYSFTVAGVTQNNALWTDVDVVVNPAEVQTWVPITGYVGAGDVIIIDFTSTGNTGITLKYEPTGGAMYQVNLLVQ